MGFLGRLMKNAVEEQGEEQDEFAAEENGLLMVPSLPGEAAPPSAAEENGAEAQAPVAAPVPPEDAPAQPVAGGEVAPGLTGTSPAAQSESEPVPAEGPQPEEGSSDGTMDLFRTAATRESLLSSTLKEGLEDVSVKDLLAEARSILDSLSGGRSGAAERRREAA